MFLSLEKPKTTNRPALEFYTVLWEITVTCMCCTIGNQWI